MADSAPLTSSTGNVKTPTIVLGPDGKPCKPCTAFRNWKPGQKQSSSGGKSTASIMAVMASGQAAATTSTSDTPPPNCPADVEQLGRATWTFLHTTAAYYPDHPTPVQRSTMLGLLNALPSLYPCSHCASHLGGNMKDHPPDVSGRTALSRWLCDRHNDVNERLGKTTFNCDKTDERWKDGPADGSCDE